MGIRKCEICGKTKPQNEFSKSYKNRCKTCVADLTREKRRKVHAKKALDPSAELIAESVAILAECMGMFFFNQERLSNGLSPGYSEDTFSCLANSLREKAESLKNNLS